MALCSATSRDLVTIIKKINKQAPPPLRLLEVHGVLPGLPQPHVAGELHQELQTLDILGELSVNGFVSFKSLTIKILRVRENRDKILLEILLTF